MISCSTFLRNLFLVHSGPLFIQVQSFNDKTFASLLCGRTVIR